MQTVKPAKQRKRLFQAPDHMRHKHFAALLSPELRTSHGTRNLPVRSGDTVRVMRGDRRGFEGKVTRVDRGKYRIYIEGLTREKVDGTTVFVPVHPSKVMITRLNLDDKWRKKILERRKETQRRLEEASEKPPEKALETKEEATAERKSRVRKAVKKPAAEKGQEEPKAKKTGTRRKTEKT